MRTLKIVDDDIVFNSDGELEMISNESEEVQALERTLSTSKGEFFLSPDFGLDYGPLKVKSPRRDLIRLAMVDAITFDTRFKRIKDLTIDIDRTNRKITVNQRILKTTGETLESVVVI